MFSVFRALRVLQGAAQWNTSRYVSGVNPHDYPDLLGVDSEAAEQVFHVANRWQTILSNSAPIHQELFMVFFAHARNVHHRCDGAW